MPPRDPYLSNTNRGTVHGTLLQARDIHNLHVTSTPNTGAPEPAGPDVSLDPPRLATAVRGRTRLLGELTTAMDAGAPVPHVLTGPGGFGKTTVAAALAERAQADGRRVFWVRAGDVSTGLLEAAVEVGGSPSEAERVRDSPQRAARWVWQQLDRAPEPWLLVLDNADRPEEIDPHHRPGDQVGWLRASPAGFVLVTSRVDDPALWAPARMHSVAELDNAAAGAALADHAGEEALPGVEELAERLGGVPLALTLAGRILASHRVLFPDARALCKRLDEDGLEQLDALAEPLGRGDRGLLSGVWEVSLDLVARREPKAPVLLRLLAVLGSEGTPIPLRRLVLDVLRTEPLDMGNRAELARTVNALVVHGLVSMNREGAEDDLRLHPLVSETLRARMGEPDFALLQLAERLILHDPGQDPHLVTRTMIQVVRIHAKGLFSRVPEPDPDPTFRDMLESVRAHSKRLQESDDSARYFIDLVRPGLTRMGYRSSIRTLKGMARAMLLIGEAKEIEKQFTDLVGVLKDDPDPRESISLDLLRAESFVHQGRMDEAEAEFHRLLSEAHEHLGAEDGITTGIRNRIALFTAGQEGWDRARDTFLRGIGEGERSDGAGPLEVLCAKEVLALIALDRGHSAEAASELEEVHALRVQEVGEYHPATARIRHHQAVLAYERGDLRLARTWFTECLRVRERALGPNAPLTEQTHAWIEHTGREQDRLSRCSGDPC